MSEEGSRELKKRASITHPAFSGPQDNHQSGPTSPVLDHTGSLLRMFRSEAFDAHLHIAYLFKMKDNQGVQDYLTNELYRMREKDVDFYLPELCLMGLWRPGNDKLHAFLLDKAASRMYYACKIHWMFQSAVEDKPASSDLLENAMKLYQESEMAVVNSRAYSSRVIELRRINSSAPNSVPTSPTTRNSIDEEAESTDEPFDSLGAIRTLSRHVTVKATEKGLIDASFPMYREIGDAIPSSTSHWRGGAIAAADVMSPQFRREDGRRRKSDSAELDMFMLKQLRCDSFNLLNNLVAQLTKLSNNLVACSTQTERKRSLNLALAQLNHWLFDRRLAMALSGGDAFMTGVSLPIPWPSSEFTHIIRAHIDDCRVFRTRQRAPYLVTLEVVDFSDLSGPQMGESVSELVFKELNGGLSDDEENLPPNQQLIKLIQTVDPDELAATLYPDTLNVSELIRRASNSGSTASSAELPPPILSPEVSPVEDPLNAPGSRKALRRATTELRKKVWGELIEDRTETMRSQSAYGHLPSWRIQRVIVKGGDDVRQEVLAGQMVCMFKNIFQGARLPLWLRPYEVVVTSANSGLIEMIPNTVSIDSLKKDFSGKPLNEIFAQVFADHLPEAQLNFIESCAAYSVVCYLLQVRDRHNGNLLLDSDGHLIHIDFGFMLSNAPGGSFALETSPFKLTQEYLDVMGGEYSSHFETFRTLIIRAFLEARKHRDQICQLVRIVGECNPKLGCFAGLGVDGAVNAMSERFLAGLTEEVCIEKIVGLIDESINNWRTIQYDNYQRITNGIL